MLGGSILNKTSSLADAISLLIVELERQFVHMHPCIKRIFLEFSNIHNPFVKRATTIFLAHEFGHIMKEASEIFGYYNINGDYPPIEEILFNQEEIRRLQSPDYAAYNENLSKKVPLPVLLDKISKTK
jgi:hypothetical protein